MKLTAKQQEVMNALADGLPHRAVFFSTDTALRLCGGNVHRNAMVKTWLKPGPSATGNLQRWFQKI